MTFTDDDDNGVILDRAKIAAGTEDWKRKRVAEKSKRRPTKAETEKRLADEDRRSRERSDREISNAELDRLRMHRKEHRREKFVSVSRAEVSHAITRKRLVRTEHDAKLAETLGRERMKAMTLVAAAFKMITAGLGMQTFNPFKVGGKRDLHRGAHLMQLYWAWAKEVQVRKLEHALCLDIAVFGKSVSECEREHSRGHRTVTANLVACLDLAVEMGITKLLKDDED